MLDAACEEPPADFHSGRSRCGSSVLALRDRPRTQFEINIESSPNVEHSKMWSEPDECALVLGLRVTDSTFYFFLRRFSYRATVGRAGECLIHSLLRPKCDPEWRVAR